MEEKNNKGLWQLLQEAPVHKIEYNPNYSLEDMAKDLERIREYDKERRERMDKEYTDIATIKGSEIEEMKKKYGENPSAAIRVKLKIGGMYGEYPLQLLYTFQETAKKEYYGKDNDRNSNR